MKINENVMLHVIPTKKFKDIGISIRFKNELHEETTTMRSLLALLLCDRCAKYNTKQKMSSYLDTLYGASLTSQTMGYGMAQVVEIRMKTINPSYAEDGEELMQDIFAFLHEILFSPLLEMDIFEEAKTMLLAKIKRNEDDPAQYAINEGLKQAGKGTPLAISSLGEAYKLKDITLEDIKETYKAMLTKDTIDILICGDVKESVIQKMVEKHLTFLPRARINQSYYLAENSLHEEVQVANRNISQTSIMMVYFTHISIVDKLYYPLRVANAMFGQYSTSLLFQEVREKNSLCYSIFSNLISYDGALGVTTGVEKEQIEKTIALIKKQFERMCNGNFSEDLLDVSKQMILNSLKASKDSMSSLVALQYQNTLLKHEEDTQDIMDKIACVTREDVLEAMSLCELKMTYIVTQGGEKDA